MGTGRAPMAGMVTCVGRKAIKPGPLLFRREIRRFYRVHYLERLSLLFPISTWLKVKLIMMNHTKTLHIGSQAPDFSLGAANREGTFSLSDLVAQGTLILEFLRGTW